MRFDININTCSAVTGEVKRSMVHFGMECTTMGLLVIHPFLADDTIL